MLVDAVRNFLNHPHTLDEDEGYDALGKHWTSLLAAHLPISHAERVPKS